MTALVSIRCDTELGDGSFCLGATATNGPTTAAGLEASALRRGWSRVGACHYCPTCTARHAHDCGHTSMQHGADGCNVPGCLCAFMSWDES